MSYGRFLREAEPSRTSTCSSCGQPLRRKPVVYALLGAMAVVLALAGGGVVVASARGVIPAWAGATLGLLLAVSWTLLTNYLGFRLVGWLPADRR